VFQIKADDLVPVAKDCRPELNTLSIGAVSLKVYAPGTTVPIQRGTETLLLAYPSPESSDENPMLELVALKQQQHQDGRLYL